jgi:hypothetical protein
MYTWREKYQKLTILYILMILNFHNFIATSDRAGSANNFVYKSCVHIPDSYKLVEEIHIQLKIGGGYSKHLIIQGFCPQTEKHNIVLYRGDSRCLSSYRIQCSLTIFAISVFRMFKWIHVCMI